MSRVGNFDSDGIRLDHQSFNTLDGSCVGLVHALGSFDDSLSVLDH